VVVSYLRSTEEREGEREEEECSKLQQNEHEGNMFPFIGVGGGINCKYGLSHHIYRYIG
jgi:hypothetical protein